MNTQLLLDLFHRPSPSGEEGLTQEYIMDFLKKRNIDFVLDEVGNVYNISNQNKPLLSAHMDTVQNEADVQMAKFTKISGNLVKGYGCIGADDKCGIWIILDLLEQGWKNEINFVFSVEEEIGGNGSKHFVSNNDLKHMPYGLILDRRGSGDIICYNNDYGTYEFETRLVTVGRPFGFSPNTGSFSDADKINDQISCANLSVGYYNAHSRNEYVVLSQLENTQNYVKSCIKTINESFEAPPKPVFGNFSGYGYGYDNEYSFFDESNFQSLSTKNHHQCECCYSQASSVVYIKTLGLEICNTCFYKLLEELESDMMDFFLNQGQM